MITFAKNTDSFLAAKQSSRETFEALAFKIVHEMDETYFQGAAHITKVTLAHFAQDFRDQRSITLGCFNSETNTIYLNRFVKQLVDLGMCLMDLQAILWHELCHAVLINAHQPLRTGNYNPCGGDHGEDFERLLGMNPVMERVLKAGVIDRLCERIATRMAMKL
jgi:hypothetical protein